MDGESFTNLFFNLSAFLSSSFSPLTIFTSSVNTKLSIHLILNELLVMSLHFGLILGGFVFSDLLKCIFDNRFWLEEINIKTTMVNLYH
ncbi:hypothetical protein BK648_15630 [Pseudomonas poae]|uniref:Uncharacterized protein n=1 Tax=Pseudomonas poae TaxID=200451 RepID=A0A423EYF0_9PSED|nr:hypothetical protein BK648_15630 [Pseudomonas poae]